MKIGIIGAMEEELAHLRSLLLMSKVENYNHTELVTGLIGNIEIALVCSGIGKVNAAVATTLLINDFKPDFLINVGVAGGFKSGVDIGDIIVSSELCHYDADATIFSYERGQIPMMPPSFKCDSRLLDMAKNAGKQMHTRVHFGQIVSGDSFIHNNYQISDLQCNFPEALAVEMEGAAIAQTGYLFSTPFIVIRAISDLVLEPENSSVYKNSLEKAATISSEMLFAMLDQIGETYYAEN